MPSVLNEIEIKAMEINPKDQSYPFENLIFEGGGNKGLAYCGAVRVREEYSNQFDREWIKPEECNIMLYMYLIKSIL